MYRYLYIARELRDNYLSVGANIFKIIHHPVETAEVTQEMTMTRTGQLCIHILIVLRLVTTIKQTVV